MMSAATHSRHEPIAEAGLADGCERCAQHGQRPFLSLDDDCLRELVERVDAGRPPRSGAESMAMAAVEDVRRAMRRLGGLGLAVPRG